VGIIEDYQQAVSETAGKFQFLEEGLKLYLENCFQIVKSNLPKEISFNFNRKYVENKPLRQLIQLFEKYNSNSELIKQLKALPEKRNHIAHKAYLAVAFHRDDPVYLQTQMREVKEMSQVVDGMVREIFDECARVEAFRDARSV
jgi:hypothetical protein